MNKGLDIVVTWPKKQSLETYLSNLKDAKRDGLLINFHIHLPPANPFGKGHWIPPPDARCYRVHDGAIRGWTPIVMVVEQGPRAVKSLIEDESFWPPGWYIVCKPEFNAIQPPPMAGFRGWQWFNRDNIIYKGTNVGLSYPLDT